jgi:DNA repair protein RadC
MVTVKEVKKAENSMGEEFLDIQVLDNLIISKTGYCSFTDEGII